MALSGGWREAGGGRGGLDIVAALELAAPRLRQSLTALGYGYWLNERATKEPRRSHAGA